MPFLFDNYTCTSCTQDHPLYWPGDKAPESDDRLWFVCPTNKKPVDIRNPEFMWMSVSHHPDNAVGIKRRGG
jgi:hypothetical protein